jgi:hypothetical protein
MDEQERSSAPDQVDAPPAPDTDRGPAFSVHAVVHPVWHPLPIRSGVLSFADGVLRFTDDRRGVLFEAPRKSVSIKQDWGHGGPPSFNLHVDSDGYIVLFGMDSLSVADCLLVVSVLNATA